MDDTLINELKWVKKSIQDSKTHQEEIKEAVGELKDHQKIVDVILRGDGFGNPGLVKDVRQYVEEIKSVLESTQELEQKNYYLIEKNARQIEILIKLTENNTLKIEDNKKEIGTINNKIFKITTIAASFNFVVISVLTFREKIIKIFN